MRTSTTNHDVVLTKEELYTKNKTVLRKLKLLETTSRVSKDTTSNYLKMFDALIKLFPKDKDTIFYSLPPLKILHSTHGTFNLDKRLANINQLLAILELYVNEGTLTLETLYSSTEHLNPLFYTQVLPTYTQQEFDPSIRTTLNYQFVIGVPRTNYGTKKPTQFNLDINNTCSNLVHTILSLLKTTHPCSLTVTNSIIDFILNKFSTTELNTLLNLDVLTSISNSYNKKLSNSYRRKRIYCTDLIQYVAETRAFTPKVNAVLKNLNILTSLDNCFKCSPSLPTSSSETDIEINEETTIESSKFEKYLHIVTRQAIPVLWQTLTLDHIRSLSSKIIELYGSNYKEQLLNENSNTHYKKYLTDEKLTSIASLQINVYGEFEFGSNYKQISEYLDTLLVIKSKSTIELKIEFIELLSNILINVKNYSEVASRITKAYVELLNKTSDFIKSYSNFVLKTLISSDTLNAYVDLTIKTITYTIIFNTNPNDINLGKDFNFLLHFYSKFHTNTPRDTLTGQEFSTEMLKLVQKETPSYLQDKIKQSSKFLQYSLLHLLDFPIKFLVDLETETLELTTLIDELAWNTRLLMSKEYNLDKLPLKAVLTDKRCLALTVIENSSYKHFTIQTLRYKPLKRLS